MVVGLKKRMKQNAKTAESKIFIAFIDSFMHDRKKIGPQLKWQKFVFQI